jgi:LacI family transcriptional regulator
MVTMQDIAADLSLSRATVCYALGNNWQAKGIASQTRKAILRRSRELGYRRNRIASGLTTRNTRTIGVLIPCVADMYADMLEGVESAVGDQYALLLGISEYEGDRERKLLESFEDRMVDGLFIVNAARSENSDILKRMSASGLSIVQADRYFEGLQTDTVEADGRQLTGLLAEHLLELGHRRIAYLPSLPTYPGSTSRREGYEAAMHKRGLPTRILNLGLPDRTQWVSRYITEQIGAALDEGPLPTAIVAHDDGLLTDCIRAMDERGLSCPDDISLAGVGREDAWEWKNPLLRYVPTRAVWAVKDMGRRAAELLVERMRTPNETWPQPRWERLKGRLLVGGSTAAPRDDGIGDESFPLNKRFESCV